MCSCVPRGSFPAVRVCVLAKQTLGNDGWRQCCHAVFQLGDKAACPCLLLQGLALTARPSSLAAWRLAAGGLPAAAGPGNAVHRALSTKEGCSAGALETASSLAAVWAQTSRPRCRCRALVLERLGLNECSILDPITSSPRRPRVVFPLPWRWLPGWHD